MSPDIVPRPRAQQNALQVSMTTGVLIFAVALLSYLVSEPWLFAGLGPSAYIHALYPRHPESRFYNMVVGHLLGIVSGIAVVLALHGLAWLPTDWARIFGAVLAVVFTIVLQLRLKAYHAPAASTALLFALGAVPANLYSAASLTAGILLLASFAAVLNWLKSPSRKQNSPRHHR